MSFKVTTNELRATIKAEPGAYTTELLAQIDAYEVGGKTEVTDEIVEGWIKSAERFEAQAETESERDEANDSVLQAYDMKIFFWEAVRIGGVR
jgi:hypothetical protein